MPGAKYYGGVEQEHFRKIGEYMKDHPNGPYVYSLWSDIPDDPNEYPNWAKYLKLYQPMVAENSLAYIELRESEYVLSPIPETVCVSMFVNEETYLAVSNFEREPYELALEGLWRDRVTGETGSKFSVALNQLRFLVKV